MLDSTLAQTIANTVAPKIINETKDLKLPEDSWKIVVKIIVDEVFKQIKENAVVEVKELITINVAGPTLVSPPTGGPVAGSIIGPASSVDLKGKIT